MILTLLAMAFWGLICYEEGGGALISPDPQNLLAYTDRNEIW